MHTIWKLHKIHHKIVEQLFILKSNENKKLRLKEGIPSRCLKTQYKVLLYNNTVELQPLVYTLLITYTYFKQKNIFCRRMMAPIL